MTKLLSSILFFLMVTAACGQTNQQLFLEKEATEKWLKDQNIPAVGICYINNGQISNLQIFGEHQKGTAAPTNAIFNVASLTKPVTAMVALKLVSQGKWDLDEPLDKYWVDPDISDNPLHKKITTRFILSHQTGFANWRRMNQSKKLEFAFEPGTKYQYSGEGFEYLKKALENKFNQPLEKLAEELIFSPLKMSNTQFVWNEKIDETRFAVGYDKKSNPYEIVKRQKASAADDLLTTLEDYAKFSMFVMNGGDLTDVVFKEMIGHQVKTKENKYFGLGWEVYDLGNGDYSLSHGGSDQGTQTLVFLFPKTKEGLIIFTNSDNGRNVYIPAILRYLKENGQKLIALEMKR